MQALQFTANGKDDPSKKTSRIEVDGMGRLVPYSVSRYSSNSMTPAKPHVPTVISITDSCTQPGLALGLAL